MVGNKDHQGLIPQGTLSQSFQIVRQTMVEIGKGIGYLAAPPQPAVGDFPRFVARKGEEGEKTPATVFGNGGGGKLQQTPEGDAVGNAPLVGVALGFREIFIAPHMAVAHLPEIVRHAGKVAVATIQEIGGEPCGGHAARQSREAAATVCMTHDTDIGESGITADDAHQSAVGAEGIGIALLEIHRLLAKAVKTGRNVMPLAAEIADEGSSTTFHDDKHHLPASGKQEGVGG